MNANSILHLVYFDCRSAGHYLRMILYQIGVPFQEIHVQPNGLLPQCIQHFEISVSELPCIIYQNRVLKELYPTIRYLCQHFNRPDLLGRNLFEQTRISEIYCKSSKKRAHASSVLLKFANKMLKEPHNVKKLKEEMVKQFAEVNTYFAACQMLYAETGNFLFDHLTIVDFFFYEHCYYFTSIFGDTCKKSDFLAFPYRNFFQRSDYYKTHGAKIESFPHFFPQFDPIINQGLKLMWSSQSC